MTVWDGEVVANKMFTKSLGTTVLDETNLVKKHTQVKPTCHEG